MACATLKRSLEWESLNQRPSKRRRCNPFGNSDKASQSRSINTNRSLTGNETSYSTAGFGKEKKAVFKTDNLSSLSPDKMAEKIRDEIRRLNRRKEILYTSFADRMQDSESSGCEMGPDSPRRPESPGSLIRSPDKALFTFKQVQLICERMLKEREDEMREKYDAILTTKLAEQYDAFVKFTYDQIQRRYEAAPSYLS